MRIRLLGTLEVEADDGAAVTVSGAKLRTLLALLALEAGKVVAADRLIDSLYGDQLPQRADNALQLLVSKLRQALKAGGIDPQAILTRAPGYLLDVPAAAIDALRFVTLVADGRARLEAGDPMQASSVLRSALGLWRGSALSEFAFDDFALGQRVRLEELRLSATEDCIEAELELGRHLEVAGELAELVGDNPLRERPWGQLMVALYRSGRQADALRAFQTARAHLADELGLDPGPELRRIEAAILAQDPALDPAGGSAAPDAGRRARPAGPVGNVGAPLSACLGREEELAQLGELLGAHRLVTLVGPGGVGKTRLAVEVALGETARCAGGVWMVELAPVSEDGVVPALRTALGGPPDAGTGAALAAALGPQDLLVVLDNCEHVVAAAAQVAHELVTAAPQVRVLATSREALAVPGEVLFTVPPLQQAAAVRLFAERAAAAAPGISFDEPAAVAVGDICDRLDGLPLAIELAASRARALEVTQIATRLSDRFRLLTGGSRTALPRQQTLRAVVDWSYDLLTPEERLVFERLSVFAGGTTLAAVEAVCGGAGVDATEVADAVFRLVDKSLLTCVPGPVGTRYTMLQTLADYAQERLEAGGAAEEYRRRHAAWVLGLAGAAERNAGRAATASLQDLDEEVDNIDAALAWAMAHDPTTAFEIAGRLAWFWYWTGRIDVGWRALSACLERGAPAESSPALRARTWAWGGMFGAVVQSPDALSMLERGVAEARASGDGASLGLALGIRAALTSVQGQPARALVDIDEADAWYAPTADFHAKAMMSMVRGVAATFEGRFDDALQAYERSVEEFRVSGDGWAAGVVFQRIADLAERQGRFDDAAAALEEAVARAAEVPNRFAQALLQAQLASTRLGQGRLEEAAALADEAVGRGVGHSHAAVLPQANHIRGRIAMRQGRCEDAEPDLLIAAERYRAQDYPALRATCLSDLGRVAAARGDGPAAVRLHAEAAMLAGTTEDPTVTLSALEGLALALARAGDGNRAARVLGLADVLRDGGAGPWDPNVDEREAATGAAVALLEPDELSAFRVDGRHASLDALVGDLVA